VSDISLDDPVRDLWLDEPPSAIATTAVNSLHRADIQTVRELLDLTAEDLLSADVRQFGPACLAEVRRVLEKHDLYLNGEGPK
jgi:hypothetical protein